ncbi:nascent polypeptide-associated complex subunit alpha, muscle-specific form isoform X12 [Ooceraea biroi]|uniref:nascent polypeptide-associated complex subunit alpha, muscle-specific form isoform X12 n=1 Tax=Ooceraea biroi TaxID=2015173 RepID=UPI000F07C3F4|nr:nascent polypeptide-associated complex subunit alpha, muscle-specific form isoform X12 [Ooceraea biroi]
MPANKSNLSTPRKEKSGNGLIPASTPTVAAASRKKKRSAYGSVKHKKHCKQYLQLHSEYRSTYTWHEYTGPQEHMVVRRAPQPPSTKQPSAKLQSAKSTEDENSEGPTLEPPLPRRKKCPALAYRTHEFITAADGGGIDVIDSNVVADKEVTVTSALPPSQLSKAISRISTEYRLQFAWPRKQQLMNGETQAPIPAAGGPTGTAGPPRKSLSMGALKQGMAPTGLAPVHKKRPGDFNHKRDGVQASELEPLVGGIGTDTIDGAVPEGDERDEDLSDLKITFRSVTKEEKEKENTRKVMPIASMVTAMPPAGRPSSVQARPIYGILQDDTKTDNDRAIARARKDFLIRHHLDRTTGVGDGALLPSPTREKLEPVIPRRREDVKEHRDEIQPRTKSSPKNSPRTGRSQSLGPTVTDRRSPKRQPARAPSISKDAKEKEKETKDKDKDQRERSGERERHPRPTAAGPGQRVRWSIREPATPVSSATGLSTPSIPPLPPPPSGPKPAPPRRRPPQAVHRKLTAEPQLNGDVTGGDSSVASTPPSQTTQGPPASTAQPSPWLDDEPVVKSPPEPTRVKSPEQMIMRSPEPVNWTVPLDTGKTFTVTQNVREEPLTRPHSEAKTWAPSSVPSAPQSAPPELAAQHKSQHSQHSGYKSPESESVSLGSFSGINGHKDLDSERDSPLPASAQDPPTMPEKVIDIVEETKERQSPEPSTKPATNLKRLEDPTFQVEKKESGVPMTTATTTTTVTSSASPQQQQQSYRILEAESSPQSGGGSASGGGNGSGSTISGYHVLEAPAIVPGSAQRSTASDVLEKARNRFDKFWGKGNNGNTEN